jgi:catechol 2,3-dioxygenase-like lactoylglutathione lyase family enzyme
LLFGVAPVKGPGFICGGSGPMAKILTHIALHVKDRQASEAFYKEWACMVDASPDVGQKSPWLSSPGKEGTFALVLVPTAKTEHVQPIIDVTRLGFAVESREALLALYNKAVQARIVERAYEENATGTRATFRVKDPDTFLVEFWVAENPPAQRKFNNLSLHVRDMNASRAFYQKWCDMDLLFFGQLSKSCRIASRHQQDPFQIVLCDGAVAPSAQLAQEISHIGIAVESEEELQALSRQAKNENLPFLSEIRSPPYPAGTLFIIKDPDGRNVEFSVGQPLGKRTG